MSGHSKWATTKRQKGVADSKRSAIFTKVANIIAIAARKGGDPEMNFSLRVAIDKAKSVNMPKEGIERAIKRGTGELGGGAIEELIYEGIGPAQSQFIIKCLTDNRNRSAAQVRHIFSDYGGSMGAVAWNFSQQGVIRITKENLVNKNIEEFELELIDQGATDFKQEENGLTIYTKPEDLQKCIKFLEAKNISTESAEVEYVAKETISLNQEEQEKLEKFINDLDDCEDVSDYYCNIN